MKGTLKGLLTTLKTTFRKPVTAQYPDERLPVAKRFYGFPGLLWDDKVGESMCVGCQVCARYCPTECITVTMMDNPKLKEGTSKRKKIVDDFKIDLARCIVCGICVEVCNIDAIAMTHEHESGTSGRLKLIADIDRLHEMGRKWQKEVQGSPSK